MGLFTSQDADIYYEVAGKGSPIVFIQGTGLEGRAWLPQIEFFSKNYTAISFDNRGVGKSSIGKSLSLDQMAGDVRNLLKHLNIPKAHIVGHSLGGVIAQCFAINHPECVETLSLLCTFARGRDAFNMSWEKFLVSLGTVIGTSQSKRSAFLKLISSSERLKNNDRQILIEALTRVFGRNLENQPKIAFQQLKALAAYDATARLHRLASLKTLVVSASEDMVAPALFGRRLSERIKNSLFIEMPREGHAVTIQNSQAVNELLNRFISE